jgi:hypothetical protein
MLRRAVYVTSGVLTGAIGGVATFSAAYTTYEITVNKVEDREQLKLHNLNTERERKIMQCLDISSTGGAVLGGVVGYRLGNIPEFSFLRLLRVSGSGFLAGGAFALLSVVFASYIVNTVNDSESGSNGKN